MQINNNIDNCLYETEKLKHNRYVLQKEKQRLSENKNMDSEEKSMYHFSIGVILVVSTILFYKEAPILIVILPSSFVIGFPAIRKIAIYNKIARIRKQLIKLDKEITVLHEETEVKEKTKELETESEYSNNYFVENLNNKKDNTLVKTLVKRRK